MLLLAYRRIPVGCQAVTITGTTWLDPFYRAFIHWGAIDCSSLF